MTRAELFDARLHRQQVAADVDIHGLGEGGVEHVWFDVGETEVEVEQAHIVDEHVEAAICLDDRGNGRFVVLASGAITAHHG